VAVAERSLNRDPALGRMACVVGLLGNRIVHSPCIPFGVLVHCDQGGPPAGAEPIHQSNRLTTPIGDLIEGLKSKPVHQNEKNCDPWRIYQGWSQMIGLTHQRPSHIRGRGGGIVRSAEMEKYAEIVRENAGKC